MRILISSQTYEPDANGQAIFTTSLAEGLHRNGHEVMVVLPSDSMRYKQEERNGVHIRYVPAFSLSPWYPSVHLTPFPFLYVGRLFDEFRPDVVHIQDHYFLSRRVVREARKRDVPVIGTNHFLPANLSRNLMFIPAAIRSRVMPFIESRFWQHMLVLYDRLDLVTTPTATAAHILLDQGITAPVQPVSCGVDTSTFHPDPGVDRIAIRRKYGLEVEKTLFIFVGRVDYEKRLDVLLHALALLGRNDVQLAVAGRGLHLTALWDLARELGLLDDGVRFVGFVPAEDLPRLLNGADVFVMPSEAELQSIATLEAMAVGLPVLAARAGALPELVEDGVNGYLFRAGDVGDAAQCMARILDERDRWNDMGKASREKAEYHSVEGTIQAYEGLYGALVGTRLRARTLEFAEHWGQHAM